MNITKQLLFCPGPVNVADSVKAATIRQDIGHREHEFEEISKRLQVNILKLLEIKHPNRYAVCMITGSGTAGNEAILSSLGKNKRILILKNGEFGERIYQIANIHHKNVKEISFPWGTEIDTKAVEKYLKSHKVDVLCMVHHETSTGLLNPIEKIGKIAHANGVQFVVDTVSSCGAEKIDIESAHIDFLNTASGKALAAFPGIAIIVGKKKSYEALSANKPTTAYLDLYKHYTYTTTHNQTPNTPSVQLFFALDQAVANILSEGVVKRRKQIEELAKYMRHGMSDMGLKFLIESNNSSVVTSAHLPKGLSFRKLQKNLRNKNIIIYNGKGPFKDKTFQVGHMGNLSKQDASYFLSCLKEILTSPTKNKSHKTKPHMHLSFHFPSIKHIFPRPQVPHL